MRLYVLPESYQGEQTLKVKGNDSRYFTRVLRLKEGSKVIGKDQHGALYQMELCSFNRNSCTFSLAPLEKAEEGEGTDTLPAENQELPSIHLFQCTCKGKKNDTIIRMATEIGVSSITLVQSKYCVAQKDKTSLDRYKTITKEAMQQSGSLVNTKIEEVMNLKDVPSFWNNRGPLLFFHQENREGQPDLASFIQEVAPSTPVAILIGSEGGLAEEECKFLENNNGTPILLKTNILRAETAAIYALSVTQMLLQQQK